MIFKKNFPVFLLALSFFISVKAVADSPADSSLNKDSLDVPVEKGSEGETRFLSPLDLTDPSTPKFEEQKSEVPESVKSASQAVWLIKSKTKEFQGTGFFIGPNRFVTNFHVVDAFIERNAMGESYLSDKIYLSQENTDQKIKIERVLAVSFYPDLAILETKSSSPYWLKLRESAISPEEKMFIAGYPKGKFYIMENTGPVEIIEDNFVFFVNHFNLIGASGGPVLDSSAHVTGVSYSAYEELNLTTSVSTDNLKSFLEKNEQAGCKEPDLTKCLEIALQEFHKKAENNPRVQHELSIMYFRGAQSTRDEEQALYWLQRSATAGFAEAQYELSILHEEERIFPQDAEKAFDLMRSSAESGFVVAQYKLAEIYWFSGDKESSVYWLKKAALQGYALAQYRLYWLYWEGEFVLQDEEQALYWLKKAVAQGYPLAQYRYSWTYWNYWIENARLEDKWWALYWLNTAAEGDLPLAQHKSAEMYLDGEIVLEDEESFYWLKRSAEQYFLPSHSPRVWYEFSLRYWEGKGVEKNQALAIYWMENAALIDYPPAKDKLDEMYDMWE